MIMRSKKLGTQGKMVERAYNSCKQLGYQGLSMR